MSGHDGWAAQARAVDGPASADSLDSDLDEALALANDNRGDRDSRGSRDSWGSRDGRESQGSQGSQGSRDGRDSYGSQGSGGSRGSHDSRVSRDGRSGHGGQGNWSGTRADSGRTSGAPTHTPQPAEPPVATGHHRATAWPAARRLAREAGLRAARHRADAQRAEPAAHGELPLADALLADFAAPAALPRGTVRVPLDRALGLVLAAPLTALTDLPSFDTSAMDGWVVAGPGPWSVRDEGILAGHAQPAPLSDGEAATIATGARIPADTTAVIRSEHGRIDDKGQLHPLRRVAHGQDIRPRGQECRSGDLLLPAGGPVTPAVLGLAAAAGYDELVVHPRPRAEVLVLGDELLASGLPRDGLIRDALGPMLPHWLRALGVEVTAVRRIGDDAKALLKAVRGAKADLVVTTGGTASGPVDHVHPTLRALDAELLVDGVAVRPGHPMLLARIKAGQYLVGLPGNPLAAVSGLLTLAEPLLRALSGQAQAEAPYGAPLHSSVQGHPHDTRLVPVVLRQDGGSGHEWAVPLHYNGPAMLRGIAAADGLAVVPPGGAQEGHEVEIIDLPWSWGPATGDALGVPAVPLKPASITSRGPKTPPMQNPKNPSQQGSQTPDTSGDPQSPGDIRHAGDTSDAGDTGDAENAENAENTGNAGITEPPEKRSETPESPEDQTPSLPSAPSEPASVEPPPSAPSEPASVEPPPSAPPEPASVEPTPAEPLEPASVEPPPSEPPSAPPEPPPSEPRPSKPLPSEPTPTPLPPPSQAPSQAPPQPTPHVGEQPPHDTMDPATLTTTQAGTRAAGNSAGDEGCFT